MNDLVITCRVCEAKAQAQDDGVLLCEDCRADPESTLAMMNETLLAAEERFEAAYQKATPEVYDRYVSTLVAALRARDGGPSAEFQYRRRRAKTIATGDALAKLLQVEDACERIQVWWYGAAKELEALGYDVAIPETAVA